MYYQKINEMLARGIPQKEMTAPFAEEIQRANAFLLSGEGEKPDWLEDFLTSNRDKLVETICRAVSVQQGISSIRGYREGYFNEMVQNANDLHCGETMNISVRRDGASRRLVCGYRDKGFSLSNIYAFLNREMSDKIYDRSQTGTFGVGVKSFFAFVDELKILSSIRLAFRIDRNAENPVSGAAGINPQWDGEHTVLELSYSPALKTEFNTGKLTKLIDALCGCGEEDYARFFVTGTDSEMVFDIRSLIFMKLRSGTEKSIAHLVFSGSAHRVDLRCEELDGENAAWLEDKLWRTGTLRLCMDLDGVCVYERQYIYFVNHEFSVAVPLDGCAMDKNRLYATYYLKTDSSARLCPSGLLFDTQSTNIHRIDVGDSEEAIDRVYETLRACMGELYGFMCSEEAAELTLASQISDAFHNLAARYLMADRKQFPESLLNYPCCSNRSLPKMNDGGARPYIVLHRDREEYDAASYQEGDIVRELHESYFEFVEKKEVYDLRQMLADPNCIAGVKNVYSLFLGNSLDIPQENYGIAAEILNYFPSVAEFITFAVSKGRRGGGGVTDAEIDVWLTELRDSVKRHFHEQFFLKLIGRYGLNPAVACDGNIVGSNLSFKDYLFNGIRGQNGGILARRQNEQYDETYGALKAGLLRERYQDPGNAENPYQIRCIRPIKNSTAGWDGTYDYMELRRPEEGGAPVEGLDLLLEKLAMDPSLSGQVLGELPPKLFEKVPRGMRLRKTEFKYSTIDLQQIIRLTCLRNVRLDKLSKLIRAVKYRSMLSPELRDYIQLSCVEKGLSAADIAREALPMIVETLEQDRIVWDDGSACDVQIQEIVKSGSNELSHEFAEFIRRVTGFQIYVYKFASNTRKRTVAYFGGGTFTVRVGQECREIGNYQSEEKEAYIFYDNIPGDLQGVVIRVLEELGLSAKRLELIDGYIHNVSSAKAVNYLSRKRSLAKAKRELRLDWADVAQDELGEVTDNQILYRLLTARGSYDIFCPICAEVPAEAYHCEGDAKKRYDRRIVLMENEFPDTRDEAPFIVTAACQYCYERLRSTLLKAEYDGKYMYLTTQAAYGMHEKMVDIQRIELSPANIELIRKFRIGEAAPP